MAEAVRNARVLLSTWDPVPMTAELLDQCPHLELIVYAAGSVRPLVTDELRRRNITVCSAIHLNARSVAEFMLGLTLMSLKNVFHIQARIREGGRPAWLGHDKTRLRGYYGAKIGLLGYGHVTREFCTLLRPFDFELLIHDPYISEQEAAELGAKLRPMEEIMACCDVVSLHHADLPENRHMIHGGNLGLLKPGATFINTARGSLVDEEALARRLERGDITAILDVTDPEPPAADNPLYRLSNCILTPHIAGATGSEVERFGEFVIREVENWLAGRPLENPVDLNAVAEPDHSRTKA
jgi:phosphoglycerate dehydrogenase-like enzyme